MAYCSRRTGAQRYGERGTRCMPRIPEHESILLACDYKSDNPRGRKAKKDREGPPGFWKPPFSSGYSRRRTPHTHRYSLRAASAHDARLIVERFARKRHLGLLHTV